MKGRDKFVRHVLMAWMVLDQLDGNRIQVRENPHSTTPECRITRIPECVGILPLVLGLPG